MEPVACIESAKLQPLDHQEVPVLILQMLSLVLGDLWNELYSSLQETRRPCKHVGPQTSLPLKPPSLPPPHTLVLGQLPLSSVIQTFSTVPGTKADAG